MRDSPYIFFLALTACGTLSSVLCYAFIGNRKPAIFASMLLSGTLLHLVAYLFAGIESLKWLPVTMIFVSVYTYPIAIVVGNIYQRLGLFQDPIEDNHVHCEQCGYDLTGLPENRCPECGVPFYPDESDIEKKP